ncbi:hypothetical protein FSP39_022906 [Pinctada imbricata]|uniref:Uncharacterized protein n=1 Tax=Pinctada imbricata TaxID=66713 RepID=A0AA88YVU7_PINIB|nr:hypothetical protein FSP39_022906 [Pinctada imbricata]
MKIKKSKFTQEKADQTFLIHSSVDDKILGQHGGELMLERKFSCFKPCVLGILCFKTEFICDGDSVMGLKKNLEREGYEIQGFDTVYIPKIPLELTDEEFQDMNRMSEKFEEY